MASSLRLWVATPEEALLDLPQIGWARVWLADGGSIGIRPGHAPLLAETAPGPLQYGDEEGDQAFELERGIMLVDFQGISIFTSGPQDQARRAAEEVAADVRFRRLARELLSALKAGAGDDASPLEQGA